MNQTPQTTPGSETGEHTHLVVVTGMSGSGKSVALAALEDIGYYCVDNLPPELLKPFVSLKDRLGARHLAVAIDVRSSHALPQLPLLLLALQQEGIAVKLIYLEASDQVLARRFSETRRRHPLSLPSDAHAQQGLMPAIPRERDLLGELRNHAHVIDTSYLRPAQLLDYVKQLVNAPTAQLTLVFESFAFKRGVTMDADYVFDVRMLPNPYYDPALRPLTGRNAPVIEYLQQQPDVAQMLEQIAEFLRTWLPRLARDHRSYVTVAIGCTGGQHRSVYLVEQLAALFDPDWLTLKRHRELDALPRAQNQEPESAPRVS